MIAVSANFSAEDYVNFVNGRMFDAAVAKPMHAYDIQQVVDKYLDGELPLKEVGAISGYRS